MLRDLFRARFREAVLPDGGWRDSHQLWVGEIYRASSTDPEPLYLLLFDEDPTNEELRARIKNVELACPTSTKIHAYGVYISPSLENKSPRQVEVNGIKIQLLSDTSLLFGSLDLNHYARERLMRFKGTKVGGTEATLASSYVELMITKCGNTSSARPLTDVLDEWEAEESRRHLAITGTYGQRKSTAMLKYCCDWAQDFLRTPNYKRRVPLLIELRGQNPSESDPLEFISTWSSRYGLQP